MNKRLQLFFDPSRSIILFLLGTSAITLSIQVLYDYANNPGKWQGGYWVALVIIVATFIVTLWLWQQKPGRVDIQNKKQPRSRRGLILIAGPTKASNPRAIDYHKDALTHCWIISTDKSVDTINDLIKQYSGNQVNIIYGRKYTVDANDLASTYQVVMSILTKEVQKEGLRSIDIIADITGGTKPMTSGMVMACLAQHTPMQYIKVQRDDQGQVVGNPSGEPIQINTNFVPISTEE